MDVLSGVVSASGFGEMVSGPYQADKRSGVGHLAIAIDIAKCRPLAEFEADMEAMIARLKSTPRSPGVEEIFYPGELEARNAERQKREGIDIPEDTVAELNAQAKRIGIREIAT
jgi:LDH2 family malate/lactate/ureidoglycolate dehydrogenase